MNSRTILVTGTTGYVGSRLVPLLLARGFRVRAAARNLEKLQIQTWFGHPRIDPVLADMADREAVRKACEGCEAAFYLVHSMNPSEKDFAHADREAAENMAWAAEQAGLQRLLYLGGLGEDQDKLSHHLKSRAEVETILGQSQVPVTTLKAAMIVGSGSASFEILRYLVERLPIMVTPRWVHTKTQCIAIRDVLSYLIGCLENPETAGKTFDIGGPDILSYNDLMRIFAEEAGLAKRLVFPVPVLTPKLSSYWIHLVTPVHASLARPLAEGLRNEVVCREERIRSILPIFLTTMRAAIREALSVEQFENLDPLTPKRASIREALSVDQLENFDMERDPNPAWCQPGDAPWAGGTVFWDRKMFLVKGKPDEVWRPLSQIGGSTGWYYANWLWALRGVLDKCLGGVGMRKGRTHAEKIQAGDAIDFWRVKEVTEGERILLAAEMKLPGYASLEFKIRPIDEDTCELRQTALFVPHGLLGILYWYAVSPFHRFVFPGMVTNIARATGKPVEFPIKKENTTPEHKGAPA